MGTSNPTKGSEDRANNIWGYREGLPSREEIGKASFSGTMDAASRTASVEPISGWGQAAGMQVAKWVGRPFVSGDKNLQKSIVAETRKEVEKRASDALNTKGGQSPSQAFQDYESVIVGTDKYKPGTETMRVWYDRVFRNNYPGERGKDAMMSQFAEEGIQLLPEGFDPAVHLPLSSLGEAGKEIAKYSFTSSGHVGTYKTVLGYVLAEKKEDPTRSVHQILTMASRRGILMPYSGYEPEASDGAAPATPAAARAAASVTPAPAIGSTPRRSE
jgi:hypothetical protein